jgi:hypothetical protein
VTQMILTTSIAAPATAAGPATTAEIYLFPETKRHRKLRAFGPTIAIGTDPDAANAKHVSDFPTGNGASLGRFTEGFRSWRRILSSLESVEQRSRVFENVVHEAASFYARGCDKVAVVDELHDIAEANGLVQLRGVDDVQAIIADAIQGVEEHAESVPWSDLEEPPTNGKDGRASRFRLYRFDTIELSTTPNAMIKGIIPRGGLIVIWGPPKCGKSFWTFDLFMHVALGWEYRGRRVQQGGVVYLALEGGVGFRNRIVAWRRRHLAEYQDAVPFYLIDVSVDLIADHPGLIAAIQEQLGGEVPAAVVIDTLNRALNGDENAPKDMAKFIRAADKIREAFGCAVPVIHHCGIQGGRPRGHSSLGGADDVQIAVERNDAGIITATVEHMKDGPAGATISFRLASVELGLDDDGEMITSLVVVPADGVTTEKPSKLSPKAVAALRSLNDCLADMGRLPRRVDDDGEHIPDGARCVTLAEWREYLFKHNLINRDGGYREQFRRLHVTLKNAGMIGIWGENVWTVTSVTSSVTVTARDAGLHRHVTSHTPLGCDGCDAPGDDLEF